ncbi:MAG TPA: prolipoprotein diacylglyceryl transferase [Candidatus Limnocylindria bacterium]|nr:prolipoprotein diacylglyceryl transferase [Candidatus Limnocylindria bacterium]
MTHWFVYPNIDPIAFRLGPISVHWYGLSYLFGFICVFLWMNRPAGRRRLGLTTDQIQDFLIYALVGVLVGGRTGFVIADVFTKHNLGDYLAHPLNFIAIWQGGMAFHGALVGVMLAIVLYLRKHPGLRFGVLADEVVVLLSLGIFTTRLVNFINDELPGKLCLPDHPYCILFPNYPDGYRYPSQIFEAILDIVTLPIVLFVYKRNPPDGVVAWTWFTVYGVMRSVAEIWREPGFTILGLDSGQFVAVVQIFIGIAMIVFSVRRGTRTAAR